MYANSGEDSRVSQAVSEEWPFQDVSNSSYWAIYVLSQKLITRNLKLPFT